MPLIKNKALNLTEGEVLYAMQHTNSNAAAARFIGCNVDTLRKYAKQYIDPETGLTLWEKHKNQFGKRIHKNFIKHNTRADIFEILDGKRPSYDRSKLARRLIEECIFPEECAQCGFNERRITDLKVPLILIWKDGDLRNHKQENLEFICYNCFFLTHDDVFHKTERVNFKGY